MRRCACRIALGQDVDLAISTLKEIGAALREDDAFKDGILSDFSFWGVDAVDGSTVTLAGQIQCRDSARWPVQREFNRRILNEFTARGIERVVLALALALALGGGWGWGWSFNRLMRLCFYGACFLSGLFALPLSGAGLTFFAAAKKVSKESSFTTPILAMPR